MPLEGPSIALSHRQSVEPRVHGHGRSSHAFRHAVARGDASVERPGQGRARHNAKVSDRRRRRAYGSTVDVQVFPTTPEPQRGAAVLLHPIVGPICTHSINTADQQKPALRKWSKNVVAIGNVPIKGRIRLHCDLRIEFSGIGYVDTAISQ
jgi:hypothetical protein